MSQQYSYGGYGGGGGGYGAPPPQQGGGYGAPPPPPQQQQQHGGYGQPPHQQQGGYGGAQGSYGGAQGGYGGAQGGYGGAQGGYGGGQGGYGAPPPQQGGGYGGQAGGYGGGPPGGGYGRPQAYNARTGPPPGADPQLWSWFVAVDRDQSGNINPTELSQALINGDWTPFDLDTVKMLMSVFDVDRSGQISFNEFAGLWKYIKDWQDVFRRFDTDRSGSIDQGELANALSSFGYRLSPNLLRILSQKYSKYCVGLESVQRGTEGPGRLALACPRRRSDRMTFRQGGRRSAVGSRQSAEAAVPMAVCSATVAAAATSPGKTVEGQSACWPGSGTSAVGRGYGSISCLSGTLLTDAFATLPDGGGRNDNNPGWTVILARTL
ncbi:hypothetical protein ACQY0O_002036 [Thecaphora frezii]